MRILLAEDDTRIASAVRAVLEAQGYIVDVERDGEEA